MQKILEVEDKFQQACALWSQFWKHNILYIMYFGALKNTGIKKKDQKVTHHQVNSDYLWVDNKIFIFFHLLFHICVEFIPKDT